jgi:hypothetical protein
MIKRYLGRRLLYVWQLSLHPGRFCVAEHGAMYPQVPG